ncbi:MAG: hypothetical protein ABGZ35_29790, partial [Planctomycetaceae bacterium]
MPILTSTAFNQFEVLLWGAAAVLCAVKGLSDRTVRRHLLAAAVTFLLFSGSDAVEIQTGAWWRPWWLFVWKAGCVLLEIGVQNGPTSGARSACKMDPPYRTREGTGEFASGFKGQGCS